MKLSSYFRHFLKSKVNLNQSRIDDLDARLDTVTKYLQNHEVLGPLVLDVIPQGSYAHKTIIRPRSGNEFDADVLLQLEPIEDWEPKFYLAALRKAFRDSSTYESMIDLKTRCITVTYANAFHIDVVPYLERPDGSFITSRRENRLERTNPEGFTTWLDERNRVAKGHLVETIRLLKFLRDYKRTFSIKSVVLTTLLGGCVKEHRLAVDPDYYQDLPTTLCHVITDLDQSLQLAPTLPQIPNPSQRDEDFADRWDQDGYANFRDRLHYYAEKVQAAYEEPGKDASVVLWREIFGEGFQAPPTVVKEAAAEGADAEKFLDQDFGFSFVESGYRLQVKGRALYQPGFRAIGLQARGNRVEKKRKLVFEVTSCDVPEPYDVYWKIKNFGEEARRAGQLRGDIHSDGGGRERREPTAYRGNHYVECYIVKDGKCVVWRRHPVNVL